ncbi:MAG: hypothetical protein JKY88_18295 [Pseudomonadales bacterium]|nr:hypothetical protein [Pseudomonadales bacterium]
MNARIQHIFVQSVWPERVNSLTMNQASEFVKLADAAKLHDDGNTDNRHCSHLAAIAVNSAMQNSF